MKIIYTNFETKYGQTMIAEGQDGVCFFQFGADEASLLKDLKRDFLGHEYMAASGNHAQDLIDVAKTMLLYFWGDDLANLPVPLDMDGTEFQKKVWRELQTIPSGQTRSYGDIAGAVGDSNASRAVGAACGQNRLALVIPCHRVVRSDGALGDFRWGIEMKQTLLKEEKDRLTPVDLSNEDALFAA